MSIQEIVRTTMVGSYSVAALHYRQSWKQPIVLIHDLWFPNMWDNFIMALHNAGYQVVAIHLPGHGLSGDPGRAYNLEDVATGVAHAIKSFRFTKEPHLFGIGMGGMIGPLMVLNHDVRFRTMVLAGVSFLTETQQNKNRYLALAKQILDAHTLSVEERRKFVDKLAQSFFTKRSPEVITQLDNLNETLGYPEACSMLHRAALAMFNRTTIPDHQLFQTRTKTLVMLGDGDISRNIYEARHAVSAIAGGVTPVVQIPGGHLFPVESPRATLKVLLEFWAGT